MTNTQQATATKFARIDDTVMKNTEGFGQTAVVQVTIYDTDLGELLDLASWTADYGDDEATETAFIDAEAAAAIYATSLLDVELFNWEGNTISGFPLKQEWQDRVDALQAIADHWQALQ